MNNENYIDETLCAERRSKHDERFCRDRKDIETLLTGEAELRRLSIQLGEILKRHDSDIIRTEKRVCILEGRPGKLWDKLIYGIIGALGSACAAVIVALVK